MFGHQLIKAGFLSLTLSVIWSGQLSAQIDLSGQWANRLHEDVPSRGPGLEIGEWEGLPINNAARLKAESWNASVYTLPERQCIPFAADMGLTIGNVRIWSDVDTSSQQVIAWHIRHEWQAQEQVIWMDGRPHPPAYSPHTWQGFSTGKWEGNALTVSTTHLKWGNLERNGVPRSDVATLTEHYIRHGDNLTVVQIINDPIYTTEPMIRTRDLVLNPEQTFGGYTCRPAAEILNRPRGFVPHYLPGTNPFLDNATKRFQMPALALQGGAQTMYPEFAQKLRGTPGSEAQNSDRRRNPRQQKNLVDDGQIHILPVQGEVYMLAGAGANITVQVGDDAVLVVDAGESGMSDKVIAAIRQISNKPFRTLISTNFDPDHVSGNEKVAQSGSQIGGNGSTLNSGLAGVPTENSAAIVAQENVLTKMSAPTGGKAAAPTSAWPTETYATDEYEVVNGEGIQIFHEPAAHADGDSLVYFRRSDVISTGDIFSTVSYPVVDLQNGGTINGVIAGLNHILDLTIPKDKQEGGTYIIPGHGRVCDEADVLEYRDMVTIIRDRVLDLIKKGMTLEQITAAKPTLDYDGRYNATFWTADMFVEAVYRSLNAPGGVSTAR